MRIFLCEPYYAGSHRAWADGYRRNSRHEVVLVTHEGRFWKWRMQGGFVTLAADVERAAREIGPPDVLLAGDMVHVPALVGAARRALRGVAVAVYFHENQLTYPAPEPGQADLTYPVINWASAAVADLPLFNSAYHRNDFFSALPALLKNFPDYNHTPLIEEVAARAEVMPVGVDLSRLDGARRRDGGSPIVLWNQRWEYDKRPDEFLAALYELADEGVEFRVALAGENFRQQPAEFQTARHRLGDRLVHFGYAAEDEYVELLRAATVVASTARHEFFGISVVEAIYAGAFPVLPGRLVYPEHLPIAFHDRCLYTDRDGLTARMRWALEHPVAAGEVAAAIKPAIAAYDWSVVAPRYDARLGALAEVGPRPEGAG